MGLGVLEGLKLFLISCYRDVKRGHKTFRKQLLICSGVQLLSEIMSQWTSPSVWIPAFLQMSQHSQDQKGSQNWDLQKGNNREDRRKFSQ